MIAHKPLTAPVAERPPVSLAAPGTAIPLPPGAPCCHPVSRCQYRPEAVGWMLRMIDELAQSGLSPTEALASVLFDRSDDRRPPLGPGLPKAAVLVADLSRAMKAGHRDPMSVARFLCPFAAACEEGGRPW